MTTPERALNATVYRLGDRLPPEIREALKQTAMYHEPDDLAVAPEPIVCQQEPFSDVVLRIATLVVIGAIVFTCLLIFVPTP